MCVHAPTNQPPGLQVCKLRVWSEEDGSLFERLKVVARGYMDQIAGSCHDRFQALADEPGGKELLAWNVDAGRLVGMRRQDHPEVCFRESGVKGK